MRCGEEMVKLEDRKQRILENFSFQDEDARNFIGKKLTSEAITRLNELAEHPPATAEEVFEGSETDQQLDRRQAVYALALIQRAIDR